MNLRCRTFIGGFTRASLPIAEARTARRLLGSIDEPVASLPLAHLDESTGSLDDYRDRFVILDIWTTWCRPCRAEIADLKRLAQRYADKGVVVVGIDEGEATQVATDFINNNNGLTYPVLPDPSLGYWKTYVTLGIPFAMFIDHQGRIVRRLDGQRAYDEFEEALRAALHVP